MIEKKIEMPPTNISVCEHKHFPMATASYSLSGGVGALIFALPITQSPQTKEARYLRTPPLITKASDRRICICYRKRSSAYLPQMRRTTKKRIFSRYFFVACFNEHTHTHIRSSHTHSFPHTLPHRA